MVTMPELLDDLRAEQEALDARVGGLHDPGWATPTPAEGWDVRDCVSHLAFFDEQATLALTDPERFREAAAALVGGTSGGAPPDVALGRSMTGHELLARWREGRERLLAAAGATEPGTRVPWYGPAMSLASFVTARLMETWAHGQDVADALGQPPVVSSRLRHVCHIGVGARAYAFAANGLEDPGDPIRVEATAPDGEVWTWGPADAADRVTGTALDLALLLTQRRNVADTGVSVEGPTAERWIAIAQAFAGPATPHRAAGLGPVRA